MIVSSDAVVLRGMKYRDTSRILTLYTRAFGKLSAIAKGAREKNNRFGAALEPMSYVRAVFYKKDASELHLLSQCDVLRPMRRLTDDMERMAPAMAMVEFVDRVCHAEEENEPLFNLLVGGLSAADSATKNPVNTLYAFEVRLLDLMGFRPNFHACSHCGAPIDDTMLERPEVQLHASAGGILCGECSPRGNGLEGLSGGSVKILQRFQNLASLEASTLVTLTPRHKNEISGLLRVLLQNHIEGLKALKSERVFSAIL